MMVGPRQDHGSSNLLHLLNDFLGLVVIFDPDRLLLLFLQDQQGLDIALQGLDILLDIFGIIKSLLLNGISFDLLQVL